MNAQNITVTYTQEVKVTPSKVITVQAGVGHKCEVLLAVERTAPLSYDEREYRQDAEAIVAWLRNGIMGGTYDEVRRLLKDK